MKLKKAFMLFIILLWTVAGVTLVIQLNKEDEEAVVEVFGQIDCDKLQSRFYAEGVLQFDYLTGNEQVKLLEDMAKQIGITNNYEIVNESEGNNRTVGIQKQSDSAAVDMKVITYEVEVDDNVVQTKQYFSLELYLYKYTEEIVVLKQEIEKVLKNSPFECNVGLEFEAEFGGELSLAEKNRLSKWYLKEINAKVVSEEKNSQIYTVYAYTDYIRDYEIVNNNAINVNLVFNYDEENNKTWFYMATPYLFGEY